MKKFYSLFFIAIFSSHLPAQTWTQKANFGGTGRYGAAGFSIGSKAYIGTGYDATGKKNDFWEWNQSTNVWSQKAAFGGTARYAAVGMSIGTMGYIGLGNDGAAKGDWWEWNSTSNIWTKKADAPAARAGATGFSIGTTGYIVGGMNTNLIYGDCYAWDQASNTWSTKAAVSTARQNSTSFVIGNYGYVGLGTGGGNVFLNDFWQYDPSADAWTAKTNFGGSARTYAAGFAVSGMGYIGTGNSAAAYNNDIWQYNPASNAWTQMANFGGSARYNAVGFSIGSCGYIGTGYDSQYKNDFWQYGSCSSGVEEIDLNSLVSVYPTIGSGNFFVSLEEPDLKILSAEVYSVSGAKIYEVKDSPQNVKLNLTQLSEGIYFLRINLKEGIATKKIIISR